MHRHSFTTIGWLALCALAACAEATADRAPAREPPPPVQVPLIEVTEAPSPEILTLTGTIVADRRSEVSADTAGKVIAVLVERGARVARGQPVVELDVRTAAITTREAKAALARARAERQLADQECARAAMLLERGAITRSEYDRTTTQCAAAREQVGAASASVARLAKSVRDGVVRAPFDGVVAERHVMVGEWVAPGRTLFTLVDAEPLTIELSVPEANVAAVELGQAVTLKTIARPGQAYRATITRLGAEIGTSRSLIVEATVAATPDLVPGMFAEAEIVVGHTNRPVVPATAVAERDGEWHAFVVRGGELEDRIVQVGRAPAPDQVALLRNVAAGERVVQIVTDDIVDGLRVE